MPSMFFLSVLASLASNAIVIVNAHSRASRITGRQSTGDQYCPSASDGLCTDNAFTFLICQNPAQVCLF
jgi:hypothetical protein